MISKVQQRSVRRRRSVAVETETGNVQRTTQAENIEQRNQLPSLPSQTHALHPPPNPTAELHTYGGIKLGWIQGVLIPCLLNIWGVMLFLRIAWIVAQAGIKLTVVIIFISSLVCVITTLSLSAICTNGEVQGGGIYYLVSRSLGAELGASVGIIFAFANAVAASMNTIGFCDSLNELLKSHGLKIFDNDVNDVRLIGAIALLVMCFICAVGMDWETKTQNFLIVVILLAIGNYIVGCFLGPRTDTQRAQGFVGLSIKTVKQNWEPDFRYSEGSYHNFFSVFAMYFPAVTGVQAGANICGDLKNPASAIPKGTLTALGVSITSYLMMAVLAGSGALRDASGKISDVTSQNISSCKPDCGYGLHNSYAIMQLMSAWGPLIYGGCWAATLSTALTNLLSVPRLIQALGVDRIYPGLIYFSKPYGRHGEPYRGYVLTFLVSLGFLLIADLNTIAPLITNFYLASYALINFCTFHAAFIRHISWRPSFRFYNKWLSLGGFVICVVIMMIISWMMALITVLIFLTLYLLVVYRKPDAHWGSSTEAQRYRATISNIIGMFHRTQTSIKCYNPQLLVLAGEPFERPALLDVADLVTNSGSFMVVANICQTEMSYQERTESSFIGNDWLHDHKHRGFYVVADKMDMVSGVRALLEFSGLGKLKPNIMLIGYKENWTISPMEELLMYVRTLQLVYSEQLAISIFRPSSVGNQAKTLSHASMDALRNARDDQQHNRVHAVMNSSSDIEEPKNDNQDGEAEKPLNVEAEEGRSRRPGATKTGDGMSQIASFGLVMESMTNLVQFAPPGPSLLHKPLHLNIEKSLDAWWLYDDGGLNILLPYIISNRGFKGKKMPLRIFALPKAHLGIAEARKHLRSLLTQYRIEYTSLTLVTGLDKPPSAMSWLLFDILIQNFITANNEPCPDDYRARSVDLTTHRAKTSRYLRLRELLVEESKRTGLIVLTLPCPRKEGVPAALYMSWLEVLSRSLPPVLFVRGNNIPVLNM